MLVVTWLVVFALVGFCPVDTIPRPTPNRISCIKPSLADQSMIGKPSEIKLPTSRLSNWYHDSHMFTGEACTQKTTTHNEDLNLPSKASPSPSAVAVDKARTQSNLLLLQGRQACFATCGKATVSPYDTFCCEEGQYCSTINGTPTCTRSTSVETQGFSSTSSTSIYITPIPSSQTVGSSSAAVGPSSIFEVLSTTSSALTTQLSTQQSSSTTSDPQTSTTGSSQSSSSPPSSSVTNLSSSSSLTSITFTPTPTSSSSLDTSDKISLGVGLGIGIPGLIGTIIAAYFAYKQLKLLLLQHHRNSVHS